MILSKKVFLQIFTKMLSLEDKVGSILREVSFFSLICNIDANCIFLTIDFCENLQEYFSVWNQFLIIKNDKNNKNIKY